QHPNGAAGNVLSDHGSGIAAAAIQPIEFATVGAHFDRSGRHLVVRVDPLEAVPLSVVPTSHKFDPAILCAAGGKEHAEPLICEITSETLLIPLDQVAFAGGHVHAVEVEMSLVAPVVLNQQFRGKIARKLLDTASDAGLRSQGTDVARFEVDSPG